VHLIQQLYAAGLSSRTIRDLLPCVLDGRAGTAHPAPYQVPGQAPGQVPGQGQPPAVEGEQPPQQ
ncbi:hypothetical protein ABZ630_31070, partial [Streptomyces albidoflavus]